MSSKTNPWSMLLIISALLLGQGALATARAAQTTHPHPGKVFFEPGHGLTARSADGDFSLSVWARGQLRYSLRRGAPGEDVEQLWQLRRASLFFAGHVFTPDVGYFVQLIVSPTELGVGRDGEQHSPLFDWFVTYQRLRDFSLRAGQFKPFFSRQFISSWGALQMVDRSLAELTFLVDRDVGVDFYSRDFLGLSCMRYHVGVFSGQGRDATATGAPALQLTARLEILPLGLFDDLGEADLSRSRKLRLSIGLAYALGYRMRRDHGVVGGLYADGGTSTDHSATADLQLKIVGLSLRGAVYLRRSARQVGDAVDENGQPVPATPARSGWAAMGQLGYVLPWVPLELAARVATVRPLGDDTSIVRGGEVAGAASYYLAAHRLKFQIDYTRSFSGSSLRRGEDRMRAQLQLSL